MKVNRAVLKEYGLEFKFLLLQKIVERLKARNRSIIWRIKQYPSIYDARKLLPKT